ncbi:hypothetical protein GCM10010399_47790 [Dactylosporangium fulvum]|uniref:Uncharacterized protein n=1 Tax=Dactylosporangium fulvum TaxID=53359 RepID=A0ABY5VRN5_9ACTN|nr:hypothetical protein [Dactylosporangium fulvum]UWP80433.1 hypothetical protein Dfulv_35465 [Dactylosporangium fulvum]
MRFDGLWPASVGTHIPPARTVAEPEMRWRYATNAGTAAVLSNRGGFARVRSIVNRSSSDLEEMANGIGIAAGDAVLKIPHRPEWTA